MSCRIASHSLSAGVLVAALAAAAFSACGSERTRVSPELGGNAGTADSGGRAGDGGMDATKVAADAPALDAPAGRADLAALGSGGAGGGGPVLANGGATGTGTGGSFTSASGEVNGTGGSGGPDTPAAGGAGETGGSSDAQPPDGPLGTAGTLGDSTRFTSATRGQDSEP
jgi:hypothetical protein